MLSKWGAETYQAFSEAVDLYRLDTDQIIIQVFADLNTSQSKTRIFEAVVQAVSFLSWTGRMSNASAEG